MSQAPDNPEGRGPEAPADRLDAALAVAFRATPGGGPATPSQRPRVSLVAGSGGGPTADVTALLRLRLRFIGLGAVGLFSYFAVLTLVSPTRKVGLFLEHPPTLVLNWVVLAACAALTARLWSRRPLRLGELRAAELALFGAALLEMTVGLAFDLFVDRELVQPLREGDHALFHYASSWSLPFVVLIVAYGTLVPSSWRRCTAVVGLMALPPVALGAAGGLYEGGMSQAFVQSYLLQTVLWMVAAAGVAVYGAHRLEELRREAVEARRLGQYRLLRSIGAGGMGEVYLAEHSLLRRPCALKVIRPEWAAHPASRGRFELEVQATAALTHPNTVEVYDYGHAADGTFYYVMEYLPGPNLEELVRRECPLPPARAVRLLRQVCGALGEAHSAGLVHRDVKPSNVIVCERGGIRDVAKLLDFGLAQDVRPGGGGAGPGGVFAGTPAYVAPEQAEGGPTDARSDVYSLGAVAYFLLAGRAPFVRPTHEETLAAHLREPPAPLEQLRPDVPADLRAVVMRCLEKSPADRFADVGELGRALAECACAAEATA